MSASKAGKPIWLKGTVHWFDSKSGEGMIRSDEGNLYFVHRSAIEDFSNAREKKEKALHDNKKVKFQLVDDLTFVQIAKVKEL